MYSIEIEQKSRIINIELFPRVSYSSYCELFDFPETDISVDTYPIYHIIKLVSSISLIRDEYIITEESYDLLSNKYLIEDDEIVIAKLNVTEFPDE